jgi:hypothetical protein
MQAEDESFHLLMGRKGHRQRVSLGDRSGSTFSGMSDFAAPLHHRPLAIHDLQITFSHLHGMCGLLQTCIGVIDSTSIDDDP